MRILLVTSFVLLFSLQTFAIGGRPVDEIACKPGEYPGVGCVIIRTPSGEYRGTAQLLPHSNGTLCLTAAHVVDRDISGRMMVRFDTSEGAKTIKVTEVFQHPMLDVALVKLKKSAGIPDKFLPKLPDQRFLGTIRLKYQFFGGLEAKIVGYGQTSLPGLHSAITSNGNELKCAGNVLFEDTGRGLAKTTAPWFFHETNPSNNSTFAISGDSGGPVLVDGGLAGVLKSICCSGENPLTDEDILITQDSCPAAFLYVTERGRQVYISPAEEQGKFVLKIRFHGNLLPQVELQKELNDLKQELLRKLTFEDAKTSYVIRSLLNAYLNHPSSKANRLRNTTKIENISHFSEFIKDVYELCGYKNDMLFVECEQTSLNEYVDQKILKLLEKAGGPKIVSNDFSLGMSRYEVALPAPSLERDFARELGRSLRSLSALCKTDRSFNIYQFLAGPCEQKILKAYNNYVKIRNGGKLDAADVEKL